MKSKTFLFAIFLALAGSSARAQSFYEMVFYFPAGPQQDTSFYAAFYLIEPDGTGLMRIVMDDDTPDKRSLLDCDLVQGFPKGKKGGIDYTQTYYRGSNYQVISGDSTFKDLAPIEFWFQYDAKGDEYLPWEVRTKDQYGKMLKGKIYGIRPLGDSDLTRELILDYFTKDEEIYKNLFAANIRTLPPDLKASKMFLLTVTDTEDESIGPDCETDRKKQQAYFSKLATKLEVPIVIHELLGKDLSRTNVLNKIEEIRPDKNDIVIFYYSGHGYSKEDGRLFPYLDLRPDKDIPIKKENELNMEEIYDIIKAKPSRLNLCLSDCCNWHSTVSNARSTNIANTRPSSVGLSVENMRALFMNPSRTSLMMTAAAKGQVSAGNPADGGIFTGQFRDALQKYMSINYQNITWQQITENVQQQTSTVAGYSLCPLPDDPKVFKDCKQTPMFKMN